MAATRQKPGSPVTGAPLGGAKTPPANASALVMVALGIGSLLIPSQLLSAMADVVSSNRKKMILGM